MDMVPPRFLPPESKAADNRYNRGLMRTTHITHLGPMNHEFYPGHLGMNIGLVKIKRKIRPKTENQRKSHNSWELTNVKV